MLFRGGQRDMAGALAGAAETLFGVQGVSCLFTPPSSQRQQVDSLDSRGLHQPWETVWSAVLSCRLSSQERDL